MLQRANRDQPNNQDKMRKPPSVMKAHRPNLHRKRAKTFSSTDVTPPGRVGTVTVKVVVVIRLNLKWSGVKDSDLNHYNVYIGTKSHLGISGRKRARWDVHHQFLFPYRSEAIG